MAPEILKILCGDLIVFLFNGIIIMLSGFAANVIRMKEKQMKLKRILNKTFIGLMVFIMLGCVSTMPTTSGQEIPPVSGGMDLDAVVKEAASQMEARLPAKTMVALVSVASPSTAFSEQVLTRLESAIVGSGKLVVVDRANLDKIRAEQGFQLSGEVDDDSAKSIGKLLGAGAIVTGSLTDLGEVYSLAFKAINIETATVAVSYLADLAKTTRIETLLASGGGAASTSSVSSGRNGASGGAAQAAVPAAAPASPYPVDPLKIGVWKLSGSDVQRTIWSADLVVQTYRNNAFIGYFDWYSGINETYRGREYFEGTYNELRQRVIIRGTRLENAAGLAKGVYQARVSDDGMKLTDGEWGEGVPGTWQAEWVKQ
jgi:hypothetical protein